MARFAFSRQVFFDLPPNYVLEEDSSQAGPSRGRISFHELEIEALAFICSLTYPLSLGDLSLETLNDWLMDEKDRLSFLTLALPNLPPHYKLHDQLVTSYLLVFSYKDLALSTVITSSGDEEKALASYRHLLEVARSLEIEGMAPYLGILQAEDAFAKLAPSPSDDGFPDLTDFFYGKLFRHVSPSLELFPAYGKMLHFVSPASRGPLKTILRTTPGWRLTPVSHLTREIGLAKDRLLFFQDLIHRDSSPWHLSEKVLDMTSIFQAIKLAPGSWKSRTDGVLEGLLPDGSLFHKLRSFAWTLQDYCLRNSKKAEDLPLALLLTLTDFIQDRFGLNYSDLGAFPGLCQKADINVLYVPEALLDYAWENIAPNPDEDREDLKVPLQIHSLDAVRRDLENLYPAVLRLHQYLSEEAEAGKDLSADLTDLVYSWCVLAYAGREPFFSDDGACYRYLAESPPYRKAEKSTPLWAERWHHNFGAFVTENSKIVFEGRCFVFTFETRGDMKDGAIVRRTVARGGRYEATVSDESHYLVVKPEEASSFETRQALEKIHKGTGLEIILIDDLERQLLEKGTL